MSVIFKDGQILFVSGQVAMGAACCCDEGPVPESCPGTLADSYRVTFTIQLWSGWYCDGSIVGTTDIDVIVTGSPCSWSNTEDAAYDITLGLVPGERWNLRWNSSFGPYIGKLTGSTPIGSYTDGGCAGLLGVGSEKLVNVVVSSV